MSTTGKLFSLFFKLDYRDKENSGKKKLIGILIAYLFSNTLLSFNFFSAFDERSFVILSFTSNLFLIVFIVLTDFDNLFLGKKNFETIASLPVEASQLFLAKFLSASAYILFFIIVSIIPQSVFFGLMNGSTPQILLFIAVNVLFSFFSACILILLYSGILIYFPRRAGLLMNIIQIFFLAFVFYSTTLSSQVISKNKPLNIKESILTFGFVSWLPQTFFSNAVYDIFLFLICMVITFLTFGCMFVLIRKNYSILIANSDLIRKPPKIKKPKFSILKKITDKYFLINNYESAAYNLTKNQIKNSRFLKMKYTPMVLMPVMLVAIGSFAGIKKMLLLESSVQDSFSQTEIAVLSPAIAIMLLISSRVLITNTKILDESSNDTSWIYDSLPVREKSFIIKGAVKFVQLNLFLPAFILVFLILIFKVDFLTVLLNMLYVLSAIYFINSIFLLFDKTCPFTLSSTKFNSVSMFVQIIFSMLLGIAVLMAQFFIFQNIIFVIITVIVLITVSLLLNRN